MRIVPCPSYISLNFTLKVNLIALLNLWYAGESSHNLLSVHWIWILRIGAKGLKVWFIWYVYLSFPIYLCWYTSHLKAKVVADNSLEIKSAKKIYLLIFVTKKKSGETYITSFYLIVKLFNWDLSHYLFDIWKVIPVIT